MNKLPMVVIIGRINAGKSALFNRLTETSKALVSKIPGTTRDYNLSEVNWRHKTFNLVDTGGVDIGILKNSVQALLPQKKIQPVLKANLIDLEIIKQTKSALAKANLILMLTDGQAGLMPADKELALILKKLKKPVILVVNKIDNPRWHTAVNEFYKLGLGQPAPVSALNGSGTGDLLDEIVKKIKTKRPKKLGEKTETIRVAIIGKPNVGKSSLVNKIIGENRVIVSPLPQTTREPQDAEFNFRDQKIILIDTAGLRKKSKVEAGIEKMATRKTLAVTRKADVILLLTEAHQLLNRQDLFLAGLLKKAGGGIIIVANKWDLLPKKDESTSEKIVKYYQNHFPFIAFAPIVFASAMTGRNMQNILEQILFVAQERKKIISQGEIDEVLKKIVHKKRPIQAKGSERPKIHHLEQSATNPPEFTLTLGPRQSIHFSYLRFIENQLRQNFGFIGVPVKIKVVNTRH